MHYFLTCALLFNSVSMDFEKERDSMHSSTSSSSSQLDQESYRHVKDMMNMTMDFQRVAISGEDHSGVSSY